MTASYAAFSKLIGKFRGSNRRKWTMAFKAGDRPAMIYYRGKIETLDNLKNAVIKMCKEDQPCLNKSR